MRERGDERGGNGGEEEEVEGEDVGEGRWWVGEVVEKSDRVMDGISREERR
jgi:hypothetical protein